MSKKLKFRDDMELGAIEGRKTQTRRPVKGCVHGPSPHWPGMVHGGDFVRPEHCPYGQPGAKFLIGDAEFEIVAVRVERVQDISQRDAIAEGGPPSHESIDRVSRSLGYPDFPRSWFAQLWDSIYGTTQYAWAANPWVWVIEFRRVQP